MRTQLPFFAASALAFTACVADPGADPGTVAAALEQPNGGLTTADEAPMFGAPDEFVDAQVEASSPYQDPYADAAGVAAVAVHRVAIVWGQLPPDLAADEHPVDWSGRLAVSRGGLIVRRTIGFEPATDGILPRNDRTAVAFTSVTQPFADGLVLDIVDGDPTSTEPLTLTYTRRAGGTYTLALADLLAGPQVREVDAQGDKVIALALGGDGTCRHGFGRGRWRAVRDGLGGLIGEIDDAAGAPIGHLRGLWGVRKDGAQVFFGKYIAADGAFRGLFAGHYADGELRGRWLDRSGDVGRLQGRYDASAPGADAGGHFLLRWADAACAADLPADE